MKRLFGGRSLSGDRPGPVSGAEVTPDAVEAPPAAAPEWAAPDAASGTAAPDAAVQPAEATARPEGTAECPWCSADVPVAATRCPQCGAALAEEEGPREAAIPGVTTVAPEYREYERRTAAAEKKKRPSLLSILVGEPDPRLPDVSPEHIDARVLAPPSEEVRAAMERLDREIAAGGIVDFAGAAQPTGAGAGATETGGGPAETPAGPDSAEPTAGA